MPEKKGLSLAALLGTLAAVAAIIGVPIAILTIPQANDWFFHKVLQQKNPEPTPPGPTFTPPDLEAHKWSITIRAKDFPAFEGPSAVFRGNHSYEFSGNFLVPTNAINQHIDCPSNISGAWDYVKADHTQISFDMTISAIAGRTPDEYAQCMATLKALQQQKASGTCTFINAGLCRAESLEIHLTPQ